jgi:hypothetical protein
MVYFVFAFATALDLARRAVNGMKKIDLRFYVTIVNAYAAGGHHSLRRI